MNYNTELSVCVIIVGFQYVKYNDSSNTLHDRFCAPEEGSGSRGLLPGLGGGDRVRVVENGRPAHPPAGSQ